uniref:Uncharacterized protein n=1 Tax=Pavo cristatus TaxID=9049 RepID=A0A8C9ESI7_PAVCR
RSTGGGGDRTRGAAVGPHRKLLEAAEGEGTLLIQQEPVQEEEEEAAAAAAERLALALRQRLRGWEAALAAAQRLLVWERPLHSLVTAAALGGALW